MADPALDFQRLDDCPPGALARMLAECYAPLLGELPEPTSLELRRQWDAYDGEIHRWRDTVGRCGFVTLVESDVVAFASWDPRGWPERGRIGHNCVLPPFQRRGIGERQVRKVIEHFRARGFARAEARTGEHPFFEPARRMYLKCGFRLVHLAPGTFDPAYRTVVYEIVLDG